MNTADRSLSGLDVALRRRFQFREMPPRPELLDGISIQGIDIAAMLRVLNERIEILLDRDHCIGHAYFMDLAKSNTIESLGRIFQSNILPLLEEYFFEDWQRIQWVLNDHRKNKEHRFIDRPTTDLQKLLGDGASVNEQALRWIINDKAFLSPEAYLGIIS
jgi:5-methylcytosine-specific restriction protein B